VNEYIKQLCTGKKLRPLIKSGGNVMYKKKDELRALALVKEINDFYAELNPYNGYHNEDFDKELFDTRAAVQVLRGDHDAVNDILFSIVRGVKDNPDRREEYQRAVKLQEKLLSFSTNNKTAEETVTGCLESRLAWYKKAVAIAKREIPYQNDFDWPTKETGNPLSEWVGAIRELQNTIDMLRHYQKQEKRQCIYVLLEYNDTQVFRCDPYEMFLDARLDMEIAYRKEIAGLQEDEYEKETTNIGEEGACLAAYDADVACSWEVLEVYIRTSEFADILRPYRELQNKLWSEMEVYDRQNSLVCDSAQCPGGFDAAAFYSPTKKCMWFSVSRDFPLYANANFIEAYRWCVSQGCKTVTGIDHAERILREIDPGALFKPYI